MVRNSGSSCSCLDAHRAIHAKVNMLGCSPWPCQGMSDFNSEIRFRRFVYEKLKPHLFTDVHRSEIDAQRFPALADDRFYSDQERFVAEKICAKFEFSLHGSPRLQNFPFEFHAFLHPSSRVDLHICFTQDVLRQRDHPVSVSPPKYVHLPHC